MSSAKKILLIDLFCNYFFFYSKNNLYIPIQNYFTVCEKGKLALEKKIN